MFFSEAALVCIAATVFAVLRNLLPSRCCRQNIWSSITAAGRVANATKIAETILRAIEFMSSPLPAE